MRRFILLMLWMSLSVMQSVWAAPESGPSKEIEIIINDLKSSDITLDVSRFAAVENKNITEDPLKGDYDQYTFPSLLGLDMYSYMIKFDKKSRMFWVWRTGGFSYSSILYGPGYLNNEGKIEIPN